MSYLEIKQALENGYKVFWVNTAYKVLLENGKLYIQYKYNDYMTTLFENEYKRCFKEA